MASVSWASAEIEPKLIAPVQNRLTISLAGSTSSSGIGPPLRARLELQQSAQRAAGAGVVVGVLGETTVGVGAVGAGGHLQIGDRLRVPHVAFAFGPPVELARDWAARAAGRRACCGIAERVAAQRFLGQHVEVDALDAAGGAGEAAVDHFVAQADRFEDLGALVALQRRDAHLGHHFEHALGDALAIGGHQIVIFLRDRIDNLRRRRPLDGRVGLAFATFVAFDAAFRPLHESFAASMPKGFERQVGIDRVGPVADQQAVVVHLAGLAGLDHDADPRPLRLAHQVMVHGAGRQQRR